MRLPEKKELEPLLRGLREYLLQPLSTGDIHTKHANDFVTEKDLYVESFLKKELAARFPGYAFLGEEETAPPIDPGVPTFVLDPIDGTTNFIFSYGLSAISLGVLLGGEPVVGAVYNPFTDEFYFARKGEGVTRNGAPCRVLPATGLGEVLAAVGTMPYHKEAADELFALTKRLYLSCIDVRRSGAASVDLCHVASGRVGVYVERNLSLWDFAAGAVILTEAGGRITDFEGRALAFTGKSDVVCSNGALHPALLRLLRESCGVPDT